MDATTIPTISGTNGQLLKMLGETGVDPIATLCLLSMLKAAWQKETGKDKCFLLFVRRDGKCERMTTAESEAITLRDHWLQYGMKSDIVKVEI